MTQQEKAFWNLLPEELQQISTVTMSYQNSWAMINKHLRTIYGDRADWKKGISAYQKRHIVRKCEDMSLVTTDEIRNMLAEDEKDRVTSAKLVEMLPLISSKDREAAGKATLEAAKLLGILPDSREGLFTWIVNKEGMTEKEQLDLEQKIRQEMALLNIIVKAMIDSYVPGIQLTYPIIGTVMTQPKTRYYYRGENAFYGQSRPSAYRNMDPKLPFQVQEIVNLMTLGTDPKKKKQIQIDIVGTPVEGNNYHYYIFSKGGFTDGLLQAQERGEVRLITLEDLYK